MSDELEPTAEQIAQRGRAALISRLRAAFEEAASSHADALKLDPQQLDELVARAAERADGLQWRRALASVATEDLGIGLAEALTHPAVVRAHTLLRAPSYEQALARLGPLPAADRADFEDISDRVPETAEHGEVETVQLNATHLGGIADLDSPEHDVELWFSDEGLHIIRATKEPIGRLTWAELRSLEVPSVRSWFPARRRAHAFLVIRSEEGDASFEVPGLTPDELREQLAPMLRPARRI